MDRINSGEQTEQPVNIEHVMQEVRREILERKLPGQVRLPKGDAKSQQSQYYEELYRAALAQSQNDVGLLVTPTRVPIVGPVVDFVRRKFHELVVFYVNRSATNQARVNHHILTALNLLGEIEPATVPRRENVVSTAQDDRVTMDDIHAGYRLFFGTQPEAADLEYWTNLIATERITRAHLIESFLNSHKTRTQATQNDEPGVFSADPQNR